MPERRLVTDEEAAEWAKYAEEGMGWDVDFPGYAGRALLDTREALIGVLERVLGLGEFWGNEGVGLDQHLREVDGLVRGFLARLRGGGGG